MNQPSGKFVIRMPAALHAQLRDEAMRTGQSLNRLCVGKLGANVPSSGDIRQACQSPISVDFLERVIRHWQGELVGLVLFGSSARGDATADSDIDLMLVMRPRVKIARDLYRRWDEFCRGEQCPGRISPHFVTLPGSVREAGGLWYEVALDGIPLWEIDRQVSRFLGCIRETMGHGKIQRRMLHGSPYWIRAFKENDA